MKFMLSLFPFTDEETEAQLVWPKAISPIRLKTSLNPGSLALKTVILSTVILVLVFNS